MVLKIVNVLMTLMMKYLYQGSQLWVIVIKSLSCSYVRKFIQDFQVDDDDDILLALIIMMMKTCNAVTERRHSGLAS